MTVFTRTITLTNCASVFQRAWWKKKKKNGGGGDEIDKKFIILCFFKTYFLICANTIYCLSSCTSIFRAYVDVTAFSRAKCPILSLSYRRWEWANRTLGSRRWRHNCRRKTAKYRHMLGAYGCWAGRDLYRAIPPWFSRSHLKARHKSVASTDKQGVLWTCWWTY